MILIYLFLFAIFLNTLSLAYKFIVLNHVMKSFDIYTPFSIRTFLPQNPSFQNFINLFDRQNFKSGDALTSLGIASVTVVSSLIVNSMAAFALARLEIPVSWYCVSAYSRDFIGTF